MTYLLIEFWFHSRCYEGTNLQRDEKLSPQLKIALVVVRLDHVADGFVKAHRSHLM
jgi:hypothetical protein